MSTPPTIFLDIDGVLNSGKSMRANGGRSLPFDPEAVAALSRIIEAVGPRIVISSTWRVNRPVQELNSILECHRLPRAIIDKTPTHLDENDKITTKTGVVLYQATARGKEICAWLEKNPMMNYAVIDDDNDMDGIPEDRFFQTEWMQGLTMECAELVIARLR